MTQPRVSILIPNFNNGPSSSKDGKTDLIGDLLASLWETLADDPTPLEIIAFDDGSTDESLGTLRDWSVKTWRSGEPFLTLMEDEHCGVLSVTANKLARASRGEFLVRLDGDIVIHTKNWAAKLCACFDRGPKDLAVIGPKQLSPQGRIHSMGDFLLHPHGYHHVGEGLSPNLITRAVEVDHVMGCFYCCTRGLYDELGGFDESIMRGQTVDFGMRSRLAGYRCWAVPTIEFTHRHTLRRDRSTTADTDAGIDTSRQVFRKKWGFDRIAPDLDAVRQRYAGTPLLWNALVFGVEPGVDCTPASAPPTGFDQSEWVRFNQDRDFQQYVLFKVGSTAQVAQAELGGVDRPVVVMDCGSGIVVHLLATHGIEAVGVDREAGHVKLATEFAGHHQSRVGYPGKPPVFVHQTELRRTPLADGSATLVCLFDRMEAHDNPVSMIKEARRLTGDEGALLVVSKCADLQHEQPLSPYRPYLPKQMASQVKAATNWRTMLEVQPESPGRPMIVLATDRPLRRDEGAPPAAEPAVALSLQPATSG